MSPADRRAYYAAAYQAQVAEQVGSVRDWQRRGGLLTRLGRWWFVTVLGRASQ